MLPLIATITGCATDPAKERPILRFYEQARKRAKTGDTRSPVDLTGLQITDGALPGCPRYPTFEESALIVSDPEDRQAVQIIVNPRVSGSFLDPAKKDEAFLREMRAEQERSLRQSRYTGVYLLARP
ncbi:hypothetical protein [Luteolibacter soli]|uniref:Uncharacterized protein n=1 Tax=Luteolibacter soli TaxID=3135280 RepID=A0ABU9ASZ5_9BACT